MNTRKVLCVGMALIALAGGLAPARASDDDGSYDLPVWFHWEKAELDVLIFPPAHGQLLNDDGPLGGEGPTEATPFNSYLHAIESSIGDWRTAIRTYGSPALREGVDIRPYVVGRDSIPPAALTQPEIVVVNDETKAQILGLAISTRPCIVDNSMWFGKSFSYEDMYNVNAQEFGHCLGLEHVVDGHPEHDAMNGIYMHSIGASGTHLHCASNLDVATLELVFGRVLGTGTGEVASLPVASYQTIPCPLGAGATPSPSPDPSPTGSPSPGPSPSPTSSPSPTPSGSPSPSPSPSSSASPSPSPSPSSSAGPAPSPEDPQRHARSVGFKLARHLVAKGIVRTADGYDRCSARVSVAVQRWASGKWSTVATPRSGREGRFRATVRDRRGLYRARVARSVHTSGDRDHVCKPARSRRLRHRH